MRNPQNSCRYIIVVQLKKTSDSFSSPIVHEAFPSDGYDDWWEWQLQCKEILSCSYLARLEIDMNEWQLWLRWENPPLRKRWWVGCLCGSLALKCPFFLLTWCNNERFPFRGWVHQGGSRYQAPAYLSSVLSTNEYFMHFPLLLLLCWMQMKMTWCEPKCDCIVACINRLMHVLDYMYGICHKKKSNSNRWEFIHTLQ